MICSASARADPRKVVLFDFELFDTSLQDEYVRDAHTGQRVTATSADFRGNTGES
jgi:hypothetical protein